VLGHCPSRGTAIPVMSGGRVHERAGGGWGGGLGREGLTGWWRAGGQGGASAEVERSEICSNAAEGVLVSRAGSKALIAGNTLHHNGVKAVCIQHGRGRGGEREGERERERESERAREASNGAILLAWWIAM
jgi:hypothetical protein